MKDCCNVGQKKKPSKPNFKMWLNYALYAVIAFIVLGTLLLQLFGGK